MNSAKPDAFGSHAAPLDPFVGQILDGQYEIEALIARGGMGAVYRARHTMLGDRVAIKLLRPDMQTNAQWLARFQREGQAARRFRHPNAVTVYDLRTTADRLIYMVMELVEGRTLNDELKRRGRLAPAEALSVLEPVASALDAAHRMGIVHRDLKPDNVMIGSAANEDATSDLNAPLAVNPARIKLLDLGIAKMREVANAADASSGAAAQQLTMMGQLLGTPYYMSPEQWGELPRDGNPEIDGRADIYSFGVILYELLAGRKPFGGSTLAELRRGHTTLPLAPLHEVAPHIPAPLSLIVSRALAKDRADRQATAGEVIDEMRVAITLAPTLITPPPQSRSTYDAPQGSQASQESQSPLNSVATREAGVMDRPPGQEAHYTHQQLAAFPTGAANPSNETYNASVSSPNAAPALVQSPAHHQPSAQSQPFAPASSVTPSAARRTHIVPIALGVIVLFLIVGTAMAGLLTWYYMRPNAAAEQGRTADNQNSPVTVPLSPTTNVARNEILRYWMDFFPANGLGLPTRMAGQTLRVASGQSFKLHLVSRESGYLYIVAPGERNALTTFLTAQPNAAMQLASNRVEADVPFMYPGGFGAVTLEARPGTETFTIIFSREPLTSPAFLTRESYRRLSPAELVEFEDLRTRHGQNAPVTTAGNEDDDTTKPLTIVSAFGASAEENQPVIFEITIQHYN